MNPGPSGSGMGGGGGFNSPSNGGWSGGQQGGGGGGLQARSDKIVVKGLPENCTWHTLKDRFSHAGDIKFAEMKDRGTGVISSVFDSYGPHMGPMKSRGHGVMVALERGETITYSLHRLQDRGELFVGPQTQVYGGMLLGTHVRDNDLVVNPCITKKLTNVRSAGADEKLFLTPPREMSLEQAIAFIEDDELLEITPKNLRLRKRFLDHNIRKQHEKREKEAAG